MIAGFFTKMTGHLSKGFIFFAFFGAASNLHSQTTLEVMADQPQQLEISIVDDYTKTDSSIIFGESLTITGGTTPYLFSWYLNDQLVYTDSIYELTTPIGSHVVTLYVSDANNCSSSLIFTGTEEFEAQYNRISVYPVPASSFLTISPNETFGRLDLVFYDAMGRSMMKKEILGKTMVEISFPPGIYYLQIEENGNMVDELKKIIVL
jgi:hypothetical protein